MAVWVAMGPAKGRDVDQAELRLRLSASLDPARRAADRRDRARRRRARGARPSRRVHRRHHPRAGRDCARHTRRRRSPSARWADTAASRSSCTPTSICSWCSAGRSVGPEERFVKALLHPLWDLRFQVGHHVRELARLRSPRYDQPRISARADGPAAACGRPRSHRSARGRDEIVGAGVATADSRGARDAHRSAPRRFRRHAVPARARCEGRSRCAARCVGDPDDAAARRRPPACRARAVARSPDRRRRISDADPLGTAPRHGAQRQRAELRAAGEGGRAAALRRRRTCAGASKR